MLSINTNIASLQSQKHLRFNQDMFNQASTRLSSGKRINSAKDDPSGLAISNRLTAQINGLNQAMLNTNNGISMVETAENATKTMGDVLQRMRVLAVNASNGDLGTTDLAAIDVEYQALNSELDSIVGKTVYNGQSIIGADAGAKVFQVGANAGDTLTVTTTDLTALNAAAGDVTTNANAITEIGALDTMINTLNTQVANYGASNSRLGFTVDNIENMISSNEATRGRILDTDYAKETANQMKYNILQQSSISLLGQANQNQALILQLLG